MGTVIRVLNADFGNAAVGEIKNDLINLPDSIIHTGAMIKSSDNTVPSQGFTAMGAYTDAISIPAGVTGIGGVINGAASSSGLQVDYLPLIFLDSSNNVVNSAFRSNYTPKDGELIAQLENCFSNNNYKCDLFSFAIPVPPTATKMRVSWVRPLVNTYSSGGNSFTADYRSVGVNLPELYWITED